MHFSIDVHEPAAVPVLKPQVHFQTRYCVVLRDGRVVTFSNFGGSDRQTFTSVHNIPTSNQIPLFIDPISAVWLGLVTLEELGLDQHTLATLKLAFQQDLQP
jgi:hypothetical protein